MHGMTNSKVLRGSGLRAFKTIGCQSDALSRMNDYEREFETEMICRRAFIQEFIPPGVILDENTNGQMMKAMPAAGVIQSHFAYKWVTNGCPSIRMGHTYAAALMATDVPEDKSDIKPPWPYFYIEVPNNLLKAYDSILCQWRDILGITVSHYESKVRHRMEWAYSTTGDSGVSLYRFGSSVDQLTVHPSAFPKGGTLSDLDLTEEDSRIQEMIGRLILNICLSMDNSGSYRPPRKEPIIPANNDTDPPPMAVWTLGRTLKIDCRESVRNFIFGGVKGKCPSVVTLVRGHWKNQRFGEKLASIKRIWIEPYYRGPDGLVIMKFAL